MQHQGERHDSRSNTCLRGSGLPEQRSVRQLPHRCHAQHADNNRAIEPAHHCSPVRPLPPHTPRLPARASSSNSCRCSLTCGSYAAGKGRPGAAVQHSTAQHSASVRVDSLFLGQAVASPPLGFHPSPAGRQDVESCVRFSSNRAARAAGCRGAAASVHVAAEALTSDYYTTPGLV